MRTVALLSAASILLTPASATPFAGTASMAAVHDTYPEVQCSVRPSRDEVVSHASRRPVPAPPPPPPPPPPQTNADPSMVGTRIKVDDFASTQTGSTVDVKELANSVPVARNVNDLIRMAPGTVASGTVMPEPEDRDQYQGEEVSAVLRAADSPVSTFSVDVDTGSYSNARRFLMDGGMPPSAAVRTEEFLNYFRYDYALPKDPNQPFSVTADMAVTPWNPDSRLLRIGIRGYDLDRAERPAANLTFLVDVSGSMESPDKLPLVKSALQDLAERLNPDDRVSIVVYASATGVVLQPTANKHAVIAALGCLQSGGSTAGGAGLELAYKVNQASHIKDGVNRVILATDGDFNVGISNRDTLKDFIARQRDSGTTLTALGFGRGNLNDAMMEQIADVGNGNYAYIDSAMEANKVLGQEMSSTLFTIAHDVKIQVEFNPAVVSEYRLIGYENRALREEDFDNDAVDAGDIGAGHQVTALYEIIPAGTKGWLPDRRYSPTTAAIGHGGEATWLKLRYKLPGEDESRLIEQPVASTMIGLAKAPRGDFAFIAAVAAFGQKLRGDNLLGNFGYADIIKLGRSDTDPWRRQFVELVGLAHKQGAMPDGGE